MGGAAGLEMLQKERYAIVFCDYNMPGRIGTELVSIFRKWEAIHRAGEPVAHIWGLTGFTSESITQKCIDAGMHGVLMKPLTSVVALKLIKAADQHY